MDASLINNGLLGHLSASPTPPHCASLVERGLKKHLFFIKELVRKGRRKG
jgi:hypothetical protein